MTVPCPLPFESGRTLLLLEGPDKSHTISIWAQALEKWKIPLLSKILTLRALSYVDQEKNPNSLKVPS